MADDRADERLDSTLRQMREDWDRRARENARYYVATHREEWTDEEFFASGECELANQIHKDLGNICQGRDPATMRVIEIGCGAGRVTRALARFFGEVHAVDVSGEMIDLARRAVADMPNAHVYQNNGMDLSVIPDLPFDFAFSIIVFQHIPSREVIESYLREVARLLRPGALFKFQVQGRPEIPPPPPPPPLPPPPPETLWTRLRRRFGYVPPTPAVPEEPDPWEFDAPDTWVGVMVGPEDAQEMADRAGFELRYQIGAGTQEYWLWFFKREAAE